MKIAIIGFGVAGVNAALSIRKSSPEAQISIYTDEDDWYYPRPRLYEITRGKRSPASLQF